MQGWREKLETLSRGCLDSISLTLGPQLQQWGNSILDHLGSSSGAPSAVGQEYQLGTRRLRVLRQLGEGGYSFVYLVRDVAAADSAGGLLPSPSAPHLFALKRVLCGSEEQLREAEQEVAVMRRLRHPCLLPLLDAATQLQRTPDGGSRHVVLMLFPVYDGGNLHEFVLKQRQAAQQPQQLAAGGAGASSQQARREAQRAQLRSLLHIFLQVCAALHAMHTQEPALAHRDVKPLNVLLRLRQPAAADGSQEAQQQQQQQRFQQVGSYDPVPPIEPLPSSRDADGGVGWEASGWQDGSSATAPADAAGAEAAAVIAVQQEGQQQQQQQQQQQRHHRHASWDAERGRLPREWWQQRLPQWRQQYEAVLMDFGSARHMPVVVRNRSQAMAAQEDAERHCTAPFRAPELWDVPSSCTLDERVDVWSLGCLLYFLLCGQSPFERAAGEAGGSLMLAVVK